MLVSGSDAGDEDEGAGKFSYLIRIWIKAPLFDLAVSGCICLWVRECWYLIWIWIWLFVLQPPHEVLTRKVPAS